jgi:hypothetical protein
VSCRDIAAQQALDRTIACHQRTQAIQHHLAFGGVFDGRDLGADSRGHFTRQRDAELPG